MPGLSFGSEIVSQGLDIHMLYKGDDEHIIILLFFLWGSRRSFCFVFLRVGRQSASSDDIEV